MNFDSHHLKHFAEVNGRLLKFAVEQRSREVNALQCQVAVQNGCHGNDAVGVHVRGRQFQMLYCPIHLRVGHLTSFPHQFTSLSFSLTHTHLSLFLSLSPLSHTHTHILSLTHTHPLSHTHILSLTHTHPLSHTHTHTLSLFRTHSLLHLSFLHSPSHTHTHTHSSNLKH